MQQRIIWLLFLTAFILDIFRSNTESNSKNSLNKNTSQKSSSYPDDTKIKEKKQEKNEDDDDDDDSYKVSDNFKKKKKIKNINLRIEFCQSWSHRGYFNQVKEHLESNYTNIFVEPSDYPLPSTRKLLSYLVTFMQISGVILAFAGKNIKSFAGGYIPDNFLDWIEGNKLMFGMGCFFLGNILNNNITNAGAFEIYCNEKLIWSAINNDKRVPNIESIISMVNKFGGKLLKRL